MIHFRIFYFYFETSYIDDFLLFLPFLLPLYCTLNAFFHIKLILLASSALSFQIFKSIGVLLCIYSREREYTILSILIPKPIIKKEYLQNQNEALGFIKNLSKAKILS
jgi:hypothetical protein